MKALRTKHTLRFSLSSQGMEKLKALWSRSRKRFVGHLRGENWKLVVLRFRRYYCTTPPSTSGKSPAELLLSRKIRFKLPKLILKNDAEGHDELVKQNRK